PMYAGELLVALGVLLPFLGPLTGAALVTLFLVQVSRALWEERALASALPEYAAYRRRTWMLVPRLL
ncbi:MAG TPA: protein-S-isoprenylcysteine methyltransferase, partial [Chloroflexota bacterium]